MTKSSKSWLAAGALAAALAAPVTAWAQTSNNIDDAAAGNEGSKYEFVIAGNGVSGGDTNTTVSGDTRALDRGNIGASAFLGYWVNDRVQLNLRQGFSWNEVPGAGSDTTASTRGTVDLYFPMGRLRPFVGAGFGLLYGDAISKTDNVVSPEVGIKYYLRPQTFVMLLGAYDVIFNSWNQLSDQWNDGQFVYTVALGFNW